jgi:serine/threonine-protein kinase
MGEVWRAFDTVTERTVAVKVLPAHLAGDEGFEQRFLREAKAAASLNEGHVVPIYDFGETDGRLFVAMRLVDGHDLQALLANGPLAPERAVAITEQIASALQAAHAIGLVHRDVKPSNILVAEDDFAYLIDFGIARVAGETGLTSTGMTLGTWPYMAPERFRTGTVDARADVYALACVLHQALTGQQPFPGESLEQIAAGHMFEPPPRPSQIRGSVTAAMDEVIATGMAKDPDERFTNAKDLARAARLALSNSTQLVNKPAAGITALEVADVLPADAPTEAGPTVSAAFAPTQHAQVSRDTRSSAIRTVERSPASPGAVPQRLDPRSKVLIGAIALSSISIIAIVAVTVSGGQPSPKGTGAFSTSATPTKRWTPPPMTAASPLVPTPLTPPRVGGWGRAENLAMAFQGLLPPTPQGTGYRGVRCYTFSRAVWPNGVKIACGAGGPRKMGSLELEPGTVNGCRFDIEGYPAAEARQHFYDLGPVFRDGHVENWEREGQTGILRYTNSGSSSRLAVSFDDPARSTALLDVTCVDQQPYDIWWPSAPL